MSDSPASDKPARSETRSLVRLVLFCVIIGHVAGGGAAVFLMMLESGSAFFQGYLANYYPPGAGNEQLPAFLELGSIFDGDSPVRWMLLILPMLGGLVSGLIVFTFAPEAEGHGTDAAIQAYHFKDGAVRHRVPFIKALASMITIGTGGSAGREGPIAQIGAGFGSMLGDWFGVKPHERRVLMAAGMAAGVGAIFHAPLAGALFAAEVLYRDPDFEHEVLVPSFISSIVAYSVFGGLFGFHPLFITPKYAFHNIWEIVPYLILAGVVAASAYLFVWMFYGFRGVMFDRLKNIPPHLKPAIGGLLVGIIGFALPEAIGTGYGIIQLCFDDNLAAMPTYSAFQSAFGGGVNVAYVGAAFLAAIGLAKMVTTTFTIGSGGSGGVFGPSVIIGGALGGATGLLCAQLFPGMAIQPGAFALVGMAGFFAGAANTPVSTIIMVNEMTGNYELLIPSMLVCILSYILCRNCTLYDEQLQSRLDAPSKVGKMAGAVLKRMTVNEALSGHDVSSLMFVKGDLSFTALRKQYTESLQNCFPVVDEDNKLTGVIEADDIRGIVTELSVTDLIIARDVAKPATTILSRESLLAALNKLDLGVSGLIVVDDKDETQIVGMLSRSDVIAAYNRRIRSGG